MNKELYNGINKYKRINNEMHSLIKAMEKNN